MNLRTPHGSRAHPRQSGFTLVEMMIAMVIALFLIGGLLTILQNVQRTHGNQAALAQLQDDQRVAMTLLSDSIQTAGFYPNPAVYTAADKLPAVTDKTTGITLTVGQGIAGAYAAAAPGDTLITRFTADAFNADIPSPINCNGGSNGSAGTQSYVNTFSVQKVGNNWQLVCAVNADDPVPLVSGITNMRVLYGLKRNVATDTNNSADTYVTADEVGATEWPNVTSVKITLTFLNPIAGKVATTDFTRIIGIMARTGYKT
ncbi:MAG: PilW family protein [Gammaproteobacteria bacterium]